MRKTIQYEKMKYLLIILLVSASINNIFAQTEKKFKPLYYDIEWGLMACSSDDLVANKNRRSIYEDDYYCCHDFGRDGHVRQWFVGFKPEFQLTRILGFDAGLRFTYSYGETRRNSIWKIGERGLDTYWAEIDRLDQKGFYLGIPVDLRFAPCDLDDVSVFLKLGTSFNFRVGYKNEAYCTNSALSTIEEDVEEVMGKPNLFSVPINAGVGVQFGPDGIMTFEISFPCFMRHADTFSMYDLKGTGFGFAFGVRIPQFNE